MCKKKPSGLFSIKTDRFFVVAFTLFLLFNSDRLWSYSTIRISGSPKPDLNTTEISSFMDTCAVRVFLSGLGYLNPHFKIEYDTLFVKAGKRAVIKEINFSENITLSDISSVKVPLFFSTELLNTLSTNTLEYFVSHGFPFSSVDIDVKPNTQKDSLNINFNIDTGKYGVFGIKIIYQDTSVSHLKLEKIKPDILMDEASFFNQKSIDRTLRRISMRSYVESVIASTPLITGLKGDTQLVSVPIQIVERSGMGIDGIVGFNSSSEQKWSGFLNLSLHNSFHRGENIYVNYVGEELFQKFSAGLFLSYPFMLPFLFEASFNMELSDNSYGILNGNIGITIPFADLWESGFSIELSEITNRSGQSKRIYGVDFSVRRNSEPLQRGEFCRYFRLESGSGFSGNREKILPRFKASLIGGLHIPFLKSFAIYPELSGAIMNTLLEDSLSNVELFRVGGVLSVRGYSEKAFAFYDYLYLRSSYIYYFNRVGALYLLVDGGFGSLTGRDIKKNDLLKLFGYGIGLKVPVKKSTLSLEWARNIDDGKSAGRIHLRVTNDFTKSN